MYYKFNEVKLPRISRMDICDSYQNFNLPQGDIGEFTFLFINSGKLRLHDHKSNIRLGMVICTSVDRTALSGALKPPRVFIII